MKSTLKKRVGAVTAVALLLGTLAVPTQDAQAAGKKVSITKKANVTVAKTVKIKLKNNKKKVKWKITKGKKLIKITKKTKTSATIKGVKKGTAKVQAVIGKKKYTCTVKVSAAATGSTSKSQAAATPKPGNTSTPTKKPVVSPCATATPSADLTISSVRELNEFAQKVNNGNSYSGKLIQLTADIQYDGVSVNNFVPIGHASSKSFSGTFDGCGHTISGIDVTDTTGTYSYIGLFGIINSGAVVKNVIVRDSRFISKSVHTGCIASSNRGTINNCHSREVSTESGIVNANSGTIINCSSASDVSGGSYMGGIARYNTSNGEILNCCNLGDIHSTATDYYLAIGGICGENDGIVQNCYNAGIIYSDATPGNYTFIGGITGENDKTAIVANCYCAEESAASNFGKMLGVEKNCKAFSLSEMQTETFTNLLNTNRGSNTDWLAWSIPTDGTVPYPLPGEDAISSVSIVSE